MFPAVLDRAILFLDHKNMDSKKSPIFFLSKIVIFLILSFCKYLPNESVWLRSR